MDKRGLMTIGLCAAALFVYFRWILPILSPEAAKRLREPAPPSKTEAESRPSPSASSADTTTAAPKPLKPETSAAKPAPALKPAPATPAPARKAPVKEPPAPERVVTVETKLYHAVFTSRGAALRTLVLKQYKELQGKEALTVLKPMREGVETSKLPPALRSRCALDMYGLSFGDLKANYGLESRNFRVKIETASRRVTFTTRIVLNPDTGESVAVTKTVSPAENRYDMQVSVEMANDTKHPVTPTYSISAGTGIVIQDLRRPRLEAAAGKRRSEYAIEVARMSWRKLTVGEPAPIARCDAWDIAWAGIHDKYFAAVLMPDKYAEPRVAQAVLWSFIDQKRLASLELRGDKRAQENSRNVAAGLRVVMPTLAPGQHWTQRFRYFVGPKKQDLLAQYPGLENLPSFGWFTGISKLLLSIMKGLYAIIPNYGVAIILLTLLVRLALHPLSRKSQISMHKMQKLQPKIKELQQRYKNNKRKLSEEQMKLFREHGANPMSGCLPMFFQIPVFIALYRALDSAIELRQAPFMLWINDLSQPDVLIRFPFTFFVFSSLNVLPIAMTVTFFIQQQNAPQPTDPTAQQQQKMMKFMPILFGFMLYNMPSGLTLYWFTSTLLGIVEQKIIKAQIGKLGDQPAPGKKR